MFGNPFAAPKNYGESLNKIGSLTLVVSFFSVIIFSYYVFDVGEWIGRKTGIFDNGSTTEFLGVKVQACNLAISALIAVAARAIRLHAQIAGPLGILKWYMVNNVLLPISSAISVETRVDDLAALGRKFHKSVFYDNLSEIDDHYKTMFWDSITWFWASIEASALLFFFGLVSAVFGAYSLAFMYMFLCNIIILASIFLYRVAASKSYDEVSAILDLEEKKPSIEEFFKKLGRS